VLCSSSSKSVQRLVSTSCHVCLVLESTDFATSVYNKQCCTWCPSFLTCFHPLVSSSSCQFLSALIAVWRNLLVILCTLHLRLTLGRNHLYSLIITTQMAQCYWSEESSTSFEYEPGTEPRPQVKPSSARLPVSMIEGPGSGAPCSSCVSPASANRSCLSAS
jgi:hypothetical protein